MPITIDVTRDNQPVGTILLYGITIYRPDTSCEVHDGGENKHYEFNPPLAVLDDIGNQIYAAVSQNQFFGTANGLDWSRRGK